MKAPTAESPSNYGAPAILMHWLTALLIAAALALGLVMTEMAGLTPAKLRYFSWHKWIGITVLLLTLPRIAWRLLRPAPALPATMGKGQRRAAHLAHVLLYVLLLAVPLSGLLYSQAAGVPVVYLGVLAIPALLAPDAQLKLILKSVHWVLVYGLAGLIALHLLAALKHQLIERDGLLARMLPFLK